MHHSHLLTLLRQCVKNKSSYLGKKLHCRVIKVGSDQHGPLLGNTLIDMYGKCGHPQDAVQMFDTMPERDLASWASIFTAYNLADLPWRTLALFCDMLGQDGLKPDHFVFSSVVKACASAGALKLGRQVHAQIVVSPFSNDDVVKSSLVDFYAKCGLPDNARAVFDSIMEKNILSWTSLIYGYARMERKNEAIELMRHVPENNLHAWTALVSGLLQSGCFIDALKLFIEMRRKGVDIKDPYILSSTIGGLANSVSLELGKQVHRLVIGLGYESNLFVCNTLIDMYAKCSDVKAAKEIFIHMEKRDVVSWTSIIVGMAQHGQADESLLLYDQMILAGLKPNEVTFAGLIYACSHVGLVDKGQQLFKSMVEEYKLHPSLQHYTVLLDLYSRSGHLEDAQNLLDTMPFEPDEAAWAAVLSACKRHGKTEMGLRIADRLLNLGPKDSSTCILLSNVYAGAGVWENVSKVRKLMATMELRKEPGYSCVGLARENQVFYAGEPTHAMKDEIISLLKEFDAEMRRRGYAPDTTSVLHEMEVKEKEKQLFWHSERLAVAYGLLKSAPGSTIRIVKNLRVCGDCHTVLKFISSITNREIVVRDAKRFHHFKNGQCSCHDFW